MNTKRLLSFLFICMTSLLLFSQQEKTISHYLFPDFTQGKVLMKNGTVNPALLNYNAASEEMIFDQNGQKLALAMPTLAQLDSVFIADRIFIRQNDKFMEVLLQNGFQLFAEYKCKVTPPPKPTAYGGTSETSSVDTYSSWQSDGRVYNLQLPDNFKIKPYTIYWLRKNEKLKSFASLTQIRKYYGNNKKELKTYEKEHKIHFENTDAVTELFRFMESL